MGKTLKSMLLISPKLCVCQNVKFIFDISLTKVFPCFYVWFGNAVEMSYLQNRKSRETHVININGIGMLIVFVSNAM